MRNLSIKVRLLMAAAAIVSCSALTTTAHAQAVAADAYVDPPHTRYVYEYGDVIPQGSTTVVQSGGSQLDQEVVATDYGQISNIFLTRYTPALVTVGIAGAVLLAGGAGVRMVHGWMRGAFH